MRNFYDNLIIIMDNEFKMSHSNEANVDVEN